MGCFDSTCSVSHNPVCEGDDTVMLFVGAELNPIYGPVLFNPIMLPIFGKYDDYGDIEDIDEESVGWKISQWLIKTHFQQVTLPTFRADQAWAVFKDETHCGSGQIMPDSWARGTSEYELEEPPSWSPDQVVWKQTKSNGSVVAKMFIHRRVYDYFVNIGMKHRLGFATDARIFESYLDDIPEYIQLIGEREKLLEKWLAFGKDQDAANEWLESINLSTYELMSFDNLLIIAPLGEKDFKFDTNSYHPLNYILKGDRDVKAFHHPALMAMRQLLQKLCLEERFGEAEGLLRAMVELHCFVEGLRHHNKEIVPYNGFAWEQSWGVEGAENQLAMFELFSTIATDRLQKHKEWDEE